MLVMRMSFGSIVGGGVGVGVGFSFGGGGGSPSVGAMRSTGFGVCDGAAGVGVAVAAGLVGAVVVGAGEAAGDVFVLRGLDS